MTTTIPLNETQLDVRKSERTIINIVAAEASVAHNKYAAVRNLEIPSADDELAERKPRLKAALDSKLAHYQKVRWAFEAKWGWEAFEETEAVAKITIPEYVPAKLIPAVSKLDELFDENVKGINALLAKDSRARKHKMGAENRARAEALLAAYIARDRDAIEAIVLELFAFDNVGAYNNVMQITQGPLAALAGAEGLLKKADYRYYKFWIEYAYAGYMIQMTSAYENGMKINPKCGYTKNAIFNLDIVERKLATAIKNANEAAEKEGIAPDFTVPTGHETRDYTDFIAPGGMPKMRGFADDL